MEKTATSIKINVYTVRGRWYAARWIDGEYDGCDALDVSKGASEQEAKIAAYAMPLIGTGPRIVTRGLGGEKP
jgi:shikimate kinase